MPRRTMVCVLSDTAVHAALCESRAKTTTILDRGRAPFCAPDSLLVDYDATALAAAIGEAMAQLKEPSGSVTLVVPMQWCFTHLLPMNAKKTNPEPLSFELEQYLPLPLEEVVCAFKPLGDGSVFAAAIPLAPMASLLNALEHHGVRVDRISVDVGAAAHGVRSSASHGLVILDARWGRYCGWGRDSQASVGVFSRMHPSTTNQPTRSASQTTEITEAKEGFEGWTVLELASELDQTTRAKEPSTQPSIRRVGEEAIDAIVADACLEQALNLRTGALVTGCEAERAADLGIQVLCLALVLLLVLVGGIHLRLHAIRQHLAQVDQQRLAVYQQVFKADRLPPDAALRLASERIRLEALTGKNETNVKNPQDSVCGPLELLRNVAEKLPAEVRIMLSDARVDERQILLRGQTVEHRDAERIAEAINQVSGVSARPPRTSRLQAGGVEFSITAMVGDER